MELALKAGKWTVLAGSGAAIIGGATGCEYGTSGDLIVDTYEGDVLDAGEDFPDITMGVVDVVFDSGNIPDTMDVPAIPDNGWYELAGADVGQIIDNGTPDVIEPDTIVDVVEQDPGFMGDFVDDAYVPPQDVVAPEDIDTATDDVDVVETDVFLSGDMP